MATEEIDINSYYVSEQEIATALNNNSNKNGAEKIKEELDKKLNQAQSTSYNGRFLKVKNGQITPEEVTIPSAYVHPTPSNLNGAKTPQQIYKITTDSQGHVNTAAPITASDLPNNIPVSKLTNLSTLNLSSFTVDDNFQIPYSSVQGRPEVLTDLPATNFKITANMIEAGLISYDALNSNVYTNSISSSSSKLVTSSGVYTALQGKANSVHTHKKNDITDFSHTHKKNEITDFAHTHSKSNITDFAHTHKKNDITDFSHTHKKNEITDFAHTHDNYLPTNANGTTTGTLTATKFINSTSNNANILLGNGNTLAQSTFATSVHTHKAWKRVWKKEVTEEQTTYWTYIYVNPELELAYFVAEVDSIRLSNGHRHTIAAKSTSSSLKKAIFPIDSLFITARIDGSVRIGFYGVQINSNGEGVSGFGSNVEYTIQFYDSKNTEGTSSQSGYASAIYKPQGTYQQLNDLPEV